MTNISKPKLIIIAGPNGAGKSTLAEFLKINKTITTFLNADTIAAGLGNSTKSDIDSGRALINKIDQLLSLKGDMAFETTLSGRSWMKLIKKAKKNNYEVKMYFIYVNSVEVAIDRVKKRVLEGGHNIPTETIIRRFSRSIKNFRNNYRELVDHWWLFNNTSGNAIMIADRNKVIHQQDYQDFENYEPS